MRRLTLILLLAVGIVGHSAAQESTTLPDWLPDEPLRQNVYGFDTPRVIWLDDDTLIFENEDASHEYRLTTFQYTVSTGELFALDSMPLRLELTPEVTEHYQNAPRDPIYRSPFTGELFTPVIFQSRFGVYCGVECGGGLIMLGEYPETTDFAIGNYAPLTGVYAQCGVHVSWSNADVVVVFVGGCYGYYSAMYYVNLTGSHPANRLPLYVGIITESEQHLLAISEDGSHVLYDGFSSSRELFNESLYYWQAHRPTESDPLPTVERVIEFSPNNAEPFPFAAANFIRDDDDHILAVHTDGLIRIAVDDDTREVLNPDINADWIRVGYFSPDNHHLVAVTWSGNLYVIETGI